MKNARQNIEDTVSNLNQVKQYLKDASSTVENGNTRKRIQEELSAIEGCLNECSTIVNTLKQQ